MFALHGSTVDYNTQSDWERARAENHFPITHILPRLHRDGETPAWERSESLSVNEVERLSTLQGMPFILSFMIPGSASWNNLPVYFSYGRYLK